MDIESKIKEIIDTIRLYIQQDGGDVEFIKYENNIVYLKLLGACIDCTMIDSTYKNGVEAILRDEVDPNILVEIVT